VIDAVVMTNGLTDFPSPRRNLTAAVRLIPRYQQIHQTSLACGKSELNVDYESACMSDIRMPSGPLSSKVSGNGPSSSAKISKWRCRAGKLAPGIKIRRALAQYNKYERGWVKLTTANGAGNSISRLNASQPSLVRTDAP
jgi:hypothetical protein